VRASGTLAGVPEATRPAPSPRAAAHDRPGTRAPSGRPWRLTIPAIAVETPLEGLGVEADGTLQVPTGPEAAGWYRFGAKPGDPGPAVIVGHVDSQDGPAVFYRLGTLAPGDLIRMSWKSGASVRFRVYAVREYAKSAFPTALVYGPTRAAELRLITCGGPFDAQTGHYLDNVVVFARRVPDPATTG
jgi:sortase (surface protein transpeptidase)